MDKDNVIPLRPKNPLFPPALRSRMEEGLKTSTNDPKEAVTRLEDALCAWAVSVTRTLVERLVTRATHAMMKAVND